MRDGEPSRTAFGAALHRAAHADLDRPVVFEDPLAWRILGVDRDQVLADVPPLSRLRLLVAVRHRFAEDVIAEAVARSRDAVAATLRAVGTVPDAEVVFDYAAADGQAETPGSRELAARVAAAGEPFSERWAPAELAVLLAASGFVDVEDIGRPEIRSRYLGLEPGPPGGGGHVVRARRR